MYELIEVKKDDIFTTSKIIAEGTNNQHESIVSIIRKYENDISDFGKVDFSDLKSGKRWQLERVRFKTEPFPNSQKYICFVWGKHEKNRIHRVIGWH